ncbi:MAG: hypothetical protein R3264_23075, partial [Anaerolineae bacterium]|nr:hypothetical protein [Anaerolineae bacterium]
MNSNGKITLYTDPPSVAEIGPAYVRLALGVAQWQPDLLNAYLGPPAWLADVLADPPDLATLRQHAVAVATATQQSDLPPNRRERLLRQVRALLWLIRAMEQEQIIFSEQVRMLLDVQPESVDEAFIQQAHDTLSAALPGSGPLSERWHDWQTSYTRPATTIWRFLEQAFESWREH